MEARLSLPDVAALLDEGDDEMAALRADAAAINAKIARAVRDYDDELIDAETLRTVKGRRTAELDAVQRRMAAAARTSTLSTLAASGDRVAAWRALDLSARRTVIDALMTVTLLPGRFGRFDPDTVRIDWRTE
jgi:site-specific DNA recombinase